MTLIRTISQNGESIVNPDKIGINIRIIQPKLSFIWIQYICKKYIKYGSVVLRMFIFPAGPGLLLFSQKTIPGLRFILFQHHFYRIIVYKRGNIFNVVHGAKLFSGIIDGEVPRQT